MVSSVSMLKDLPLHMWEKNISTYCKYIQEYLVSLNYTAFCLLQT